MDPSAPPPAMARLLEQRRQAHCQHKPATRCCLSSLPACCACSDQRGNRAGYLRYVDGHGESFSATRWESYCQNCRTFWENRIACNDPFLPPGMTFVPFIPDQAAFLTLWTTMVDSPFTEPVEHVPPGFLPRTADELAQGVANNARRPLNRTLDDAYLRIRFPHTQANPPAVPPRGPDNPVLRAGGSLQQRPPSMEPKDLVQDLACKICYEQLANTLLTPCNHLLLCEYCAAVVLPYNNVPCTNGPAQCLHSGATCPACRQKVKARFKVYFT